MNEVLLKSSSVNTYSGSWT